MKEDIALNEEIIVKEKKPLGQRLLNAGYRPILSLEKELDIEVVLRMEIDYEIAKLTEYEVSVKEGDLDGLKVNSRLFEKIKPFIKETKVIRREKSRNTYISRYAGEIGDRGFVEFYDGSRKVTPLMTAQVKVVKLNNYIDGFIPEEAFDKIADAKKFGIKDFYVAYPEIHKDYRQPRPERDPIIYGKIGEEMVFIYKW